MFRRPELTPNDVPLPGALQDRDLRRFGSGSAMPRVHPPGALHGPSQRNEEEFKSGSPINFARDLRGSLFTVHGTRDDNVHYRGFEALVNELGANNKQFNMLSYPNRSRAISEGRGTLYTAMTNQPEATLSPGPE
jgi:dipeptidyl aminopeptidase/acylaminoacyl peptidase